MNLNDILFIYNALEKGGGDGEDHQSLFEVLQILGGSNGQQQQPQQ